jgi:hypothetical protein
VLFCFTAFITEECPLLAGCAILERALTVFTAISILFDLRCAAYHSAVDRGGVGAAMPAEVGDTVLITVMVAVGVVTKGACWVQPAMKIPATIERPRIIKNAFRGCHDIQQKVL